MPKTAVRPKRGLQTRIKSLGFHADYACRGSGACCAGAWRVVAQPEVRTRLAAAFEAGRLRGSLNEALRSEPTLTGDPLYILRSDGPGGCTFHKGERCGIRTAVGVEAQPLGCRVFPRVVVKQPRGRFVSLSHFCPTAAGLLFKTDRAEGRPIQGPRAFPASDALEGHDARDHLPPLVAPNRPTSWSLFELWESAGAGWLVREDGRPEQLLASWAVVAERIRHRVLAGSRPEDVVKPALARAEREGPLGVLETVDWAAGDWNQLLFLIESASKVLPPERGFAAELLAALESRYLKPDGASQFEEDWRRNEAHWAMYGLAIKRYAAARHYANFHAYQGQGLRSAVLSTVFAVGLVRAFALASSGEEELTRDGLLQAIRASDYVLLHLIHRPTLAKLFSSVESVPAQDVFRLAFVPRLVSPPGSS
ncbi:MAG: YkgJ family cysteine cluster protein [Myxococcota bacterium]